MAIIDDILRGVIAPADNEALYRLAQMLGNKLVPVGAGVQDTSLLVLLSGSLLPIWIGLLFLILAYTGISGVIRSAKEGVVLGKEWGSFKVPMSFIAAIILLAPVPGFNGTVVAQYAFIKGVIFGSNAADYALREIFRNNARTAAGESFGVKDQHVQQVNEQMKIAYQQYYCGAQLVNMGYGSREDFFINLNKACSIPTENIMLFKNYFMPSLDASVNGKNDRLSQLASSLGTPIEFDRLSRQNIDDIETRTRNGSNNKEIKELTCYFNSFNLHMRQPLADDIRNALALSPGAALDFNPQGRQLTRINSDPLAVKEKYLQGAWLKALDTSYKCIMAEVTTNAITDVEDQQTGNSQPWRRGWVYSALVVGDDINSYSEAVKKATLPLTSVQVMEPQPTYLNKTLQDRDNQSILLNNLTLIRNALNGPGSGINRVAANYGAMVNNPETSGRALERSVATISMAGAAAGRVSSMSGPQLDNKVVKFLNSFIGQSARAVGTPMNIMEGFFTKRVTKMMSKVDVLLANAQKKIDASDSILKSIPGIGGVVSGLVKAGLSFVAPSPQRLAFFIYLVMFMNLLILLPQVILLIVMLLWLARVAVMFLVLPLSVVIIAIPNTRAGHDIWKSALSLALVPLMAVFFYLVSFVGMEIMYRAVWSWTLEPLTRSDLLTDIVTSVWMWFSGEIFFRVVAACLVCAAVTVFMSMMILRGPDYVSKLLHLNTSSGELGNDLEADVGQMKSRVMGKLQGHP